MSGRIWYGSGPVETWVTVPDPVDYFGEGLRAALAEGVELRGRLRPVEQLPGPLWERVAVHRSDLVDAIRVTNKRSQNFYAESLVKHLAAGAAARGAGRRGSRRSRSSWRRSAWRRAPASRCPTARG